MQAWCLLNKVSVSELEIFNTHFRVIFFDETNDVRGEI